MSKLPLFKPALLLLLCMTAPGSARANKTAAIDDDCTAVRHEFVEALPRYFSGPAPWVELDSRPPVFADAALASVFSQGLRVAWVVLEMQGPNAGWFETTHYFFDQAGGILKRERYLEQLHANVLVQESTYFHKGKSIKTRYRHSALAKGKENWDDFYDPHAPEYTSTADLPPLFIPGELTPLASTKRTSGLRTACTSQVTRRPESLLKFSRPGVFLRQGHLKSSAEPLQEGSC